MHVWGLQSHAVGGQISIDPKPKPYALRGARTNVGLKSGRYMFEAKMVEQVARADEGNKPQPKKLGEGV